MLVGDGSGALRPALRPPLDGPDDPALGVGLADLDGNGLADPIVLDGPLEVFSNRTPYPTR